MIKAGSFDDLVQLIGSYGAYQAPRGASYAMAVIINRMGGWVQVCSWRYQDLPRQRQIFNMVRRDVEHLLRSPSVGTLAPIRVGGHHEIIFIPPP